MASCTLTAMRSRGLPTEDSHLPGWSDAPQTPKFFRVALLRKLRACQQVAAVCYRVRETGIEFLLVRTRGSGRWTFPKGGAEPGLTHAQAAALEAFEEAGVHGRMEESSFTHYLARKRSTTRPAAKRSKTASGRSSEKDIPVNAHLCEVTRLSTPEESNRNPTWFSAKKAKLRLRDDRSRRKEASWHAWWIAPSAAFTACPPRLRRLRESFFAKDDGLRRSSTLQSWARRRKTLCKKCASSTTAVELR